MDHVQVKGKKRAGVSFCTAVAGLMYYVYIEKEGGWP